MIDTERSSPAKKPRLQPAEDHADGADGADGSAQVLGEHLKYGAELSLHGCAMHAHAQRTAEFGQHNVSHARDHSMDLVPADKQPVGDQASVLHVNRQL